MIVLPEEIENSPSQKAVEEYVNYMRERINFAFSQIEKQNAEILKQIENINNRLAKLENGGI